MIYCKRQLTRTDKVFHGAKRCQTPFILREKLRRTCRPVWTVVCKAEDTGLLTHVKDDNAADDDPVRPTSVSALVS